MDSQKNAIVSTKGGEVIFVKNFKFRKVGVLISGEKRWRCCIKNCKAACYTMGHDNLVVREHEVHNHLALDSAKVSAYVLCSAVKRKAVEDLSEKPTKIIRKEVVSNKLLSNSESLTTSALTSARSIYSSRRKMMPSLPKSLEEVQCLIDDLNIKTNKNENFVVANDKENKIVIFSCKSNLQMLCSVERMYMDGTFSYCTKFFKQLFTIHGEQNGHYIPLVFCLLPNKEKMTYKILFRLLNEKCVELVQSSLIPKYIIADFEAAILSAVSDMYPKSTKIGADFISVKLFGAKFKNWGYLLSIKIIILK